MNTTMVPILLYLLSYVVSAISCPRTDHCAAALGMQSGAISDDHISASSYHKADTKASQGRAHIWQSNRSWCSGVRAHGQNREFLEINLGSMHRITKVDVQRRSIIGRIKGYAEQYQLQFWRPGIDHWITYSDSQGRKLLEGNNYKYMTQTSLLSPPIIATKVRFVPYSNHHKIMCMRVELYGCHHTDGLVSYTMPDGDSWDKSYTLNDLTYDGSHNGSWLSGGLGQLTDGDIGHSNFNIDAFSQGSEGFKWVGWNNDTRGSQPVEITFDFDCIRNFSAIHIYTSNFTRDNEVFSRVRILFSMDGEHFHVLPAVKCEQTVDCISENTHSVIIGLQNVTAKYIKLRLYFAQRWILISEVSFDSGSYGCYHERWRRSSEPQDIWYVLKTEPTSMLVVGFIMMFYIYIGFPLTLCICCCLAERHIRKQLKNDANTRQPSQPPPPTAPPQVPLARPPVRKA